jgi:hypothetical protein
VPSVIPIETYKRGAEIKMKDGVVSKPTGTNASNLLVRQETRGDSRTAKVGQGTWNA